MRQLAFCASILPGSLAKIRTSRQGKWRVRCSLPAVNEHHRWTIYSTAARRTYRHSGNHGNEAADDGVTLEICLSFVFQWCRT